MVLQGPGWTGCCLCKKEQIQLRNREKYVQRQHRKTCFQIMDKTRNLFLIVLILLCSGEQGFACSCQTHWNCQNAVENCRCCFPIFLPNQKNLCLYPPQNLSYICVRRSNDEEGGVGRESDSHQLQREKAERCCPCWSRREPWCVCLFGELSEGTQRGWMQRAVFVWLQQELLSDVTLIITTANPSQERQNSLGDLIQSFCN